MKILHIIASTDPRGGGPIAGILSHADYWENRDHEFHILCLDSQEEPWLAGLPVPVFPVGYGGGVYRVLKKLLPWLRYSYTLHLAGWIRIHVANYDAVIINGIWNYASFGSWRILRKLRIPYFVYTHGMLDPWFNRAYPLKTIFKKFYWRLFEYRVLRDARAVFFTSEEEMRLASQSFRPYHARGKVVGYGTRDAPLALSEQRKAFYEKLPVLKDREYILCLGRIDRKKGIDQLIGSFAALANEYPYLDLVVAGPDRTGLSDSLKALAQHLNVADRIHWPGMLMGHEKWGAFRHCRIFALTSHQENFGVVLSEALSVAKPVLITRNVNIWREIEQDAAGIVVDDTPEDVETGLRRMVAMNADSFIGMCKAARHCFESRYDLATHSPKTIRILQTYLSEPFS